MKTSRFVPQNSKTGSYYIQYVPKKAILGTYSTKNVSKIQVLGTYDNGIKKAMDLLRIEHKDFTLTVESTQFQRMWDKGVNVLGGKKLVSSYGWSEGVEHVVLVHDDAGREITKDIADEAVFFEQTDYGVWVDFKKKASKAWFDSSRKDVNDRFSWKESKQLLAGYLNYGNEIGRADMPICYTIDGVQKRFVFSYDVISAKLDYHHDWKIILQDIEAEYRMLSLDYLKRTYHGIKEEQGESYDITSRSIPSTSRRHR